MSIRRGMEFFTKSITKLCLLLCVAVTVQFGITTLVKADPPKREQADVIAVTWFDNFTYGGWTTATGILEGVFSIGYNKIKHHNASKGFYVKLDPSGQQLIVFPAGLRFGHSGGAFNLSNGGASEYESVHEAGHGKQAAILGPLFLPVLLGSYGINQLVNGDTHDGNPFESWANAWKYLGTSMVNTRPLSVRFEKETQDGKGVTRFGTNFILLERDSKLPLTPFNDNYGGTDIPDDDPNGRKDDPVSVSYKYGQIGAYVSVDHAGCQAPVVAPIKIEGALFQKDFLAEWSTISSAIRLLIDAKQETGKVVVDLEYGRVDAKFLSQVVGMGVRIGNKDTVAIDAIGRASGAVKGEWNLGDQPDHKSAGVFATAGGEGELRLHLFDAAEIYARKDKEWGTGDYSRNADTVGIETPLLFTAKTYTGFHGHSGGPVPLYGGVFHESENETMPGPNGQSQRTHIKMTIFTLGGRW